LMYLAFRYVEGFRFLRNEHNGTVTPVLIHTVLIFWVVTVSKK